MRMGQKINNKCLYDRLLSYNKDLATTDIACVIELLTRETQMVFKHMELAECTSRSFLIRRFKMDVKYLAKILAEEKENILEELDTPFIAHPEVAKFLKRRKKKMDNILKNEYSEQFDKERKARVEVSFYKYGSARDNFASGRVDAIKTAELCLEAFKKDGNTEHLVDAANYLMFRFKYPLPGEHFTPTDSNGSVGTVGTPINMEKE